MTDRPSDEAVLRHVRGAGKLTDAERAVLKRDALANRGDHAVKASRKKGAGLRDYTRWTKQRKEAFLDVLAATSNVSEAARAVKMERRGAYVLKAKDAEFAAAWAIALERGYCELEMHLVRQVRDGTLRTEKIYDCEKGEVTHVKLIHSFPLTVGMALLTAHRAQVEEHRLAVLDDGASANAVGQLDGELDRIRARLLAPTNLFGEDGLIGEDGERE